jgi:hypothetical protein
MPLGIESAASMADWMRVLDQMQDSIARALREVDERERVMADADQPAARDAADAAERRTLDRIDERLRGLGRHLEAADRAAADIEALFAADERDARAWAELADTARRRLEARAGSGVS